MVLWLAAGCYSAAPPEGAPCGEGRTCPHGQSCSLLDNRCYRDPEGPMDGPMSTTPDTPVPTTCTPRRLLMGGGDPAAQGWTVLHTGSYTISGGSSGGQTMLMTRNDSTLLLVYRNAFPPDRWAIEVTMQVMQSGGHATNEAAIAVMPSFHDPLGSDQDRSRMMFLDMDRIGFGGTSIGAPTTAMSKYRLEHTAGGGMKVTADFGSLEIGSVISNGTIAIGDQTTSAGLDSTFSIASVDLFCP